MSTTKEAKINENKPEFNEKYTTKFNKDNNNFNERINNTLKSTTRCNKQDTRQHLT